MNSDDQRWNVTFRWIRDHCVSHHACQSVHVAPNPLGLPARRYAVIGNGVDVTSTSVMGPAAGCGLIATMPFLPRDIITAYQGELLWMPAVTAKASGTSDNRVHSHFKRISGTDYVISGFKGVDITFGSGGASVANCAARKSDANARLVTLWDKKHEDFMWCPETTRYERVSGTFLVATKPISINEEILTWYGEASRARLSLNSNTSNTAAAIESGHDDGNSDADTPAVFVEGGTVSQVRVHHVNERPPRALEQDLSRAGARFQQIFQVFYMLSFCRVSLSSPRAALMPQHERSERTTRVTVTVSDNHSVTLKRTKYPVTGDVLVGEHFVALTKLNTSTNQSRNTDWVQSLATVITPNPP